MKITTPSGHYLREATQADDQLVWDCTRDWPGGGGPWARHMCDELVRSSVANFDPLMLREDPIPSIPNFTLIQCMADDTPIAFISLAYHGSATVGETGVDIGATANLPSMRGNGYYTILSEAVGWFCNQYLMAEQGHYEILSAAPAVAHRAGMRAKTDRWAKVENGITKTMTQHTQAGYEGAAFATALDKVGYSIVMLDDQGIEITVTLRVGF